MVPDRTAALPAERQSREQNVKPSTFAEPGHARVRSPFVTSTQEGFSMTRLIRIALVIGALVALAVPLGPSAYGGKRLNDNDRDRILFATDTRGNLLAFLGGLAAPRTLDGDHRPARRRRAERHRLPAGDG
jgi:hypothetical protein